jgi:DNA segregation ATPase FtsK/SpoIIIE-like protein
MLLGCLSWPVAGSAAGTEDAAVVKKAAISLDATKVSHPCARKSAPELTKKSLPFQQSIHANAQKFRVDADLIRSVITIESCYKEKALSPKSAQGLMQLIPATAERFGVSDVYDSAQNIRGGTQYLGWLSQRFGGDLVKVLAAYNAGEGKVDRYDGIPPYRETRHYVHDVLVVYKKFKQHRQTIAAAQTKQQQAEQERQRQLAQQRQQQQQQQQLARQRQAQQQQARQQQAQTAVQPPPNNNNVHYTQQIVIGQTSQPIRQPPPVLRKASAKVITNTNPVQKQAAPQRVKKVYAAPFKPGRGGLQANKQRAPHLYKQ